jgi:hypothetical protein
VDVSKEFVPYLNITTHLEDTPDQDLLNEKGGTGFPTLFFIEPETGAVLNDWWWPEDEEAVREMFGKATAKAKELQDLQQRAAQNPEDQGLQATLALKLAMMRAANRSLDELRELSQAPGVDPAVKAEFDGWYPGAKVTQVMSDAQSKAQEMEWSREELFDEIAKAFYGMLKDGVRLPHDDDNAQIFYDQGLNGAVAQGDREVAQAAFEGYRSTLQKMADARPDVADQVAEYIASAKERLDGIPAKEE